MEQVAASVYIVGVLYALSIFIRNDEIRWYQTILFALFWPIVWLFVSLLDSPER